MEESLSLSLFFSSPSRIHQLGVDSGMQEADKLHSSEDRIWAFLVSCGIIYSRLQPPL